MYRKYFESPTGRLILSTLIGSHFSKFPSDFTAEMVYWVRGVDKYESSYHSKFLKNQWVG